MSFFIGQKTGNITVGFQEEAKLYQLSDIYFSLSIKKSQIFPVVVQVYRKKIVYVAVRLTCIASFL